MCKNDEGNSHAKFRGAARRGFSVIYEKPPGGRISAPLSVRGLKGLWIALSRGAVALLVPELCADL